MKTEIGQKSWERKEEKVGKNKMKRPVHSLINHKRELKGIILINILYSDQVRCVQKRTKSKKHNISLKGGILGKCSNLASVFFNGQNSKATHFLLMPPNSRFINTPICTLLLHIHHIQIKLLPFVHSFTSKTLNETKRWRSWFHMEHLLSLPYCLLFCS